MSVKMSKANLNWKIANNRFKLVCREHKLN